MTCIEITVLWLSISVCRPETEAPRARREHRVARIAPETEIALKQLERARERLRVQEKDLAEALRLVRGK